jgi:molecular chaperone GrpE (heat shock protein)
MNNPLKYYYICRRSEIEETLMELSRDIDKLCAIVGHINKETIHNAEEEDIIEKLHMLGSEVRGLSEVLEDISKKQRDAAKDIMTLKAAAQNAGNRANELEKQLEELKVYQKQERDSNERRILETAEKAAACERDKRLRLINSLIKFRDQLLIFRDNTEDEEEVKLLSNLYRETGRFMMENGIEILYGQGDFSTDNQIVIGTVETEAPELLNTIESTFRDGYIVDGKMLRPQEVVVYVR